MAPHCQNLFITQAVHVIQFFKRKKKLPFSVNIRVLLTYNETKRGKVFIFFHGIALAMTND